MYSQQYPPYYPLQQQPQLHGAPNGAPRDPFLAMRKDEQRRKQQEYAQALAQQVQQRDMRRQQERDIDRQAPGPTATAAPGFHQPQQVYHEDQVPGKGMFDGLGQNQQRERTNFARGQRPQPQAASVMPQSYNQQPMPGFVQQPQQFPAENHPFQSDMGGPLGHPFDSQAPPYPHAAAIPMPPVPMMNDQHNASYPMMQQPPGFHDTMPFNQQVDMTQHQQYQRPPTSDNFHSQPNQPQQQQGGRRIRTDINGSDPATDERTRQKLQQQQAMQLALQRQVEEKKKQKLEEKRRQEEEDRKEMERFEVEKRRLEQEKERLKEEKRRKAEEDAVRATQQHAAFVQQTKAAAAAKTVHYQTQQQPGLASEKQNPFVNSRAKLFEEPERSPVHISNNFQDEHEQQRAFVPRNAAYQPPVQPMQHFQQPQMRGAVEMHPSGHQDQRVGPPQMDMSTLLRHYDEIKQELMQQKQMVEQLRQAHANIQHQQQQQPVHGVLTISDLEELRQELHEELEHRQYLHQQEVAELKRQQQHQQQERRSFNQIGHGPIDHSDRRSSHTHEPRVQHRASEHYASTSPKPTRQSHLDSASPSPTRSGNFKRSTKHSISSSSPEQKLQTSSLLDAPISADDSGPSTLPCDSKLVYFNGHVTEGNSAALTPHPGLDSLEGDSMDQFIAASELEIAVAKEKSPLPFKEKPERRIEASVPGNNGVELVRTADDFEDSLDFFVDDFELHPHESHSETIKSVTKSTRKTEIRLKQPPRNNRYELGGMNDEWNSLASVHHSSSLSTYGHDDIVIDEGESDDEDSDDVGLDTLSLDGTQLTAIFQRNVRRYEILRGFEATTQGQPPRRTAWNQLHQLLEANSNSSHIALKHQRKPEESLVASSRWMPSSIVTGDP